MKKLLDRNQLITYTNGQYKGKIDWERNIGKELYFEYDNLTGYIKILDYYKIPHKSRLILQYQNNIISASTQNFLHLKIPSLFNMQKQSNEYKYNVGEIISKYNDKIQILEQIRIKYNNSSCRGYLIKCLDCGYIYDTREDTLSTCTVCGYRSSYAERYIYSILRQSSIDFIPQKEFDWLPNRWYDIFLPKYNVIIEIHGQQHYMPTRLNHKETPVETYINNLKIDKIKKEASIQNNLSYYIIDARDLNNLFSQAKQVLTFIDFSNISISECIRFADHKRIYKECDLWNKGFEINEICNMLNESKIMVQSKLRVGNSCNMCNYSKKINMSNHKIINPNR